MAGEFRGYVETTGTVPGISGTDPHQGIDTFSVQMPTDIQAGDYLFVLFGGSFNLRKIWSDVAGPWTNIGSGDSHAKIADGSEGGTSVAFWVYNGGFDGVRPLSAIALCYRFPTPPTVFPPSAGLSYLGGTLRELGNRIYTNASGDSAVTDLPFSVGGQFGGFVGSNPEFRIYHAEGASSNGDATESYSPSAATWRGDLITDRTGIRVPGGGTYPNGIDAGGHTAADAFYLSIAATGSTHDTAIDFDGPGVSFSGRMEGWIIVFPVIPIVDYWGILAVSP